MSPASSIEGNVQKSSSSKDFKSPHSPFAKGEWGGFASGAYSQYVSTATWRERRWRLFSTLPGDTDQSSPTSAGFTTNSIIKV